MKYLKEYHSWRKDINQHKSWNTFPSRALTNNLKILPATSNKAHDPIVPKSNEKLTENYFLQELVMTKKNTNTDTTYHIILTYRTKFNFGSNKLQFLKVKTGQNPNESKIHQNLSKINGT